MTKNLPKKSINPNKEVIKKIRLYIPAQNSSSLTTLNAVLGQSGLNSFEFSKEFNKLSDVYLNDIILSIEIKIFIDKSYDISLKSPFLSFLLNEEIFVFNKIKESSEISSHLINILSLKQLYK